MIERDGPRATVVMVLYETTSLDLSWVPLGQPIVLVHNDDKFDPASLDREVTHIRMGGNVGFGTAQNRGVACATTPRVIICNPDTELRPEHWNALVTSVEDDVVTVPLVDMADTPTSVVNTYPSPFGHLAAGLRLGRFVPRGSLLRRLLALVPWGWAASNARSFALSEGAWPLADRWVSGAVMSIDRSRYAAVDGFDESYFLYFEDIDLCRRLARRHPELTARLARVAPGRHHVSLSTTGSNRRTTDLHHARSAVLYASSEPGLAWRSVAAALRLRVRWIQRTVSGGSGRDAR